MSKGFQRISVIVIALLVSLSSAVTAFAANEKRIDTKQGGYILVSNVTDVIKFKDEGAGVGDTIYVAKGSASIMIRGFDFKPVGKYAVQYLPDGKLAGGSFDIGEKREGVEVSINSVTISKPGYYSVAGYFGGEYTPEATAAFVIQIVGEETGDQAKPATPQQAVPTAAKVMVNGIGVAFEAYNIDGNNYFKLRDLAQALSGTGKQFDVTFDNTKNTIRVTPDKKYTAVGGELAGSASPAAKTAAPTASKLVFGDKELQFAAYNIDGSNYFKLRDVAKMINFGVTWDDKNNTVGIDTKSAYSE